MGGMGATFRGPDGTRRVGAGRDSLVERMIGEAQERGEFDDLPHRGERLPLPDDAHAGSMAAAFTVLRNAGAAPLWIEADREARRWLERRDAILAAAATLSLPMRATRRRELAEAVGRANASIELLALAAPAARLHRRRLVLEDELAAFDLAAAQSGARSAPG